MRGTDDLNEDDLFGDFNKSPPEEHEETGARKDADQEEEEEEDEEAARPAEASVIGA